jgi:hypothetical protein
MDRTGRIAAIWPGFATGYRRRIRRFDPDLYLTAPHRPPRGEPGNPEQAGPSAPAAASPTP